MRRLNIIYLLGFFAILTVQAETHVVHVPSTAQPIQNGLALQTALANITTATQQQPYLITLSPGTYQLQAPLKMKAFVSLVGAGTLATHITGTGQADYHSGTVIGADHAALRSLTIENTGQAPYAIALYNHNASPRLQAVALRVSGATFYNAGVFNYLANPILSQVDIIIEASQQTTHNRGLYNLSASPELNQVNIQVALAETSSYGIYNVSAGFNTLTIHHSRIQGATHSIVNAPGYLVKVYVAHSQLAGSVNGGGLTCFSAFDGNYQALDARCQ